MLGSQLRQEFTGVHHVAVFDVSATRLYFFLELRALLRIHASPRILWRHQLQLDLRALGQVGRLVADEIAVSDVGLHRCHAVHLNSFFLVWTGLDTESAQRYWRPWIAANASYRTSVRNV